MCSTRAVHVQCTCSACAVHVQNMQSSIGIKFFFNIFLFVLQWSDDPVFMSQGKYRANTQRQLKEMLYKDIIDYFDKGKVN